MSKLKPTEIHPKVGGTAPGAYVAVILVWLLGSYGFEVPDEVAVAIAGLLAFVGGYLASSPS